MVACILQKFSCGVIYLNSGEDLSFLHLPLVISSILRAKKFRLDVLNRVGFLIQAEEHVRVLDDAYSLHYFWVPVVLSYKV